MEKSLRDLWPILDVEHDCILSRQGDVTVAFRVKLPELFTLSQGEYSAFHQAWVKALKVLPSHTVVCKQDWFFESRYEADFSGTSDSFLSSSSERFFNERPFLDHEGYVMITKKPAKRKQGSVLFSSLISPSIVPEETLEPQALHHFLSSTSQFQRILEDSGFVSLEKLTDAELLSKPGHCGLLESYCKLGKTGGEPMLEDISFEDTIRIGNDHCQLYSLADTADLPGYCAPYHRYEKYSTDRTTFSTGFATSLGQLLDCNHVFSQYFFLEDGAKTIRKLESKRLRLQSLAAYSRENSLALDATNEFLNEAIKGQKLPIRAHFNVLVWTNEPGKLKEIESKVSSAIAQMDAVTKLETVSAPQIFWAGIPGNHADFPVEETFDTFAEQAACFINMESGYRSSVSPVGLRLGDRLTGRPLHVDISDEPIKKGICTNRNKFILGPSGSGKSFFTNHMLRTYYEQGSHIVLVDVGHSYKGLCDLVDGYYFSYSESDPIRFNPFYTEDGKRPDTEKKESIKTLLLALWKKDTETYRRSEYVALSNALTLYYDHLEQNLNIGPSFNTFYEFLKSGFTEKLKEDKVKDRDFDLSNFLYVLRPYYRGGELDYLLNATENLDLLSERFIVFELDAVKDHPILFPVITIIIMEVFISKMRKLKGIRKLILVEEAWKALMKEGFAQYVQYLFKTVRKFFGEAIVVTQEVEDIISSPIVKQAIINNSDCKILLDQSKYQNKFDQIQELLGLTEKEKALVLSVNKANDPAKKYKEVFISLGGVLSRVYRTEVSAEEYLAYTTEETEKLKVNAYAKKHGSMERGIAALAAEMIEKP